MENGISFETLVEMQVIIERLAESMNDEDCKVDEINISVFKKMGTAIAIFHAGNNSIHLYKDNVGKYRVYTKEDKHDI